VLAGLFSFGTGIAISFAMLVVFRFGNGLGVLANSPIHNSLISDYYTPNARPTAYATHTNAVYIANIIGPALAGAAGAIFGWRAAFFVLFGPIAVTTVIALRLHEPVRGGTDRPGHPAPEHDPPQFWDAARTLWGIRTLKRCFWASIPLGAGVIPLVLYLSLFFEREYHLGPFQRGLILAANAACTYVGVQQGGKLTPGWLAVGMGVPLQRVGMVLGVVGVGVLLTAWSPWLALTILVGLVTNLAVGYFFAPLAAVQALVSPARERSLSFSLGAIFLALGVVVFFGLGLGSIADDHGLRWALVATAPFWFIAGYVAFTAGKFVQEDVARNFA
jgi:branched-chain amino acid transport system ATP-binding protein